MDTLSLTMYKTGGCLKQYKHVLTKQSRHDNNTCMISTSCKQINAQKQTLKPCNNNIYLAMQYNNISYV